MLLALASLLTALLQNPQHNAAIPMDSGLTVVQSVSGDAYQGRDYETVITVRSPAEGVTLGSAAFVKDRAGERNWLRVVRTVTAQDLSGARALVLGFDTDDAEVLTGTTAIGPSHVVLDELEHMGRAAVSVRRHASHPEAGGTLERVGTGNVAFPILLNGVRVNVPALHARGRLGATPWEFWFLDHPVQPLTLRASQGVEGAPDASRPEWSRQIVRIDVLADVTLLDGGAIGGEDGMKAGEGDVELASGAGEPFPAPKDSGSAGGGSEPEGVGSGTGQMDGAGGAGRTGRMGGGAGAGAGAGRGKLASGGAGGGGAGRGAGLAAGTGGAGNMESRLAAACRVSVPGIYFEFDSDVLNPASAPWVRAVADLLRRQPDWTVTIEGHTDSIGSPRYNQDLSRRRAEALKRSLVGEHAIAAARLATQGFGPSRPLESNSTVEGRARNRRVELVRPCGAAGQ